MTALRRTRTNCSTNPQVGGTSRFAIAGTATLLAALLSACTSVSLDEPPRRQSAQPASPVPATPPPPTVVLRPPQSSAPQGAISTPVSPQGASVITVDPNSRSASPAPLPSPPPQVPPAVPAGAALPGVSNAAVDARFPAPSVVYNTPGLGANRVSFSTPTEVRAWLASLTSLASRPGTLNAAVLDMGRSQQGMPIDALVMTQESDFVGSALTASDKPTVVLVAGQHGDAPASTEAALVMARELAQGSLRGMLEQLNVIVVPRVNPDGFVNSSPLASNGVDIARDHVKLATLEAQAVARLLRDYRPTVVIDMDEYPVDPRFTSQFGALPAHDLLLQYGTTANMPEFLTRADEEWFRRPLVTTLDRELLSNEWLYAMSPDASDKTLSMGTLDAGSLRNAAGLRNSVSFSIASRGEGIARAHIQRRVHALVTAAGSLLRSTVTRASELKQLRPYLDREVAQHACRDDASLGNVQSDGKYNLTMIDPVTGKDKLVVVDWKSSLQTTTSKTRIRPCGYWLNAASVDAVQRLRLAGVQVMKIVETSSIIGDFYRRSAADGAYTLQRGLIDTPAGSYYVPMNQAWGNFAFAALEPDVESSYVANGLISNPDGIARIMGEPGTRMDPVR